jgi:hypothetical protein
LKQPPASREKITATQRRARPPGWKKLLMGKMPEKKFLQSNAPSNAGRHLHRQALPSSHKIKAGKPG